MADEVKEIAVVDSGQMDAGIALLAAANGLDVLLLDSDPAALAGAQIYISGFAQRLVSTRHFSQEQANDALIRLKYTLKLEDFHSADIIIEAIVKSEAAKKKMFPKLDKIARKSAIF